MARQFLRDLNDGRPTYREMVEWEQRQAAFVIPPEFQIRQRFEKIRRRFLTKKV